MKLEDFIKTVKSIEPDRDYSSFSRRAILATNPIMPAKTFWQVMSNSFQFGSAVALTGVLMVLFLGGFSTWKFLSPFKLASLNTSDLRAEAQAIDVQLELAKIQYAEPAMAAETRAMEPMAAAMSAAPAPKSVARGVAESEAENLGIVTPPPTSTKEMSIDDALSALLD